MTRVLVICADGIRLPDILPRLEAAFSRPGADYDVLTICDAEDGHDIDWQVDEWARARGLRATTGFPDVAQAMWHADGQHCMVFGADARCREAIGLAKRGTYSPYYSRFRQRSKGVELRVLEV